MCVTVTLHGSYKLMLAAVLLLVLLLYYIELGLWRFFVCEPARPGGNRSAGKPKDVGSIPRLRLTFLLKKEEVIYGHCLVTALHN